MSGPHARFGELASPARSGAGPAPDRSAMPAAFEDDEGLDNSLREQAAEALGAKYAELDI